MAPPHDDPSDLTRLVEELTARSIADQADAVQRYRSLLERVASGELDPMRTRAEYDRLVSEHSARFAQDLTTLGVDYYRAVLELNRTYVERTLDRLDTSPRTEDAARPPSRPDTTITLTGRLGETLTTSFVVENPDAAPARVTFFLADIVSEDNHAFRGAIDVQPPRLDLSGGEEQRVTLAVELDSERFVAGRTYRTELLVRGIREFVLLLEIDVID